MGPELDSISCFSVFINVGKSTQILLRNLFRSDGSVQIAHHSCLGFIWDLKQLEVVRTWNEKE